MFAGFSLITFSYSQIEIQSDDVLELIGKSVIFEQLNAVPTIVEVGQSGPDKTWDFRAMNFNQPVSHTQSFESQEGTVFADEFPDANFVIHSQVQGGDIYNYYEVSDEALKDMGVGNDFLIQGAPYQEVIKGSYLLAPLPLSMGSTWQVVNRDTITSGLFTSITYDSTFNEVDSWGVVKLPAGDFKCLRIKSRSTSIEESIFDGQSSTITNSVISYSWITKEAFIVSSMSSLYNELEERFTTALFVSRVSSVDNSTAVKDLSILQEAELNVFPNPFMDHLTATIKVTKPGRFHIELLISVINASLYWQTRILKKGII
ncbi:MAG: hypothetical protein IPL46_05890 [Saprospiraceae bacterium]|nr:hypothetical protein [Saprospiraceae bacterium]